MMSQSRTKRITPSRSCLWLETRSALRMVDAGNGQGDSMALDVERLTALRRGLHLNADRRSYHIDCRAGASPAPTPQGDV